MDINKAIKDLIKQAKDNSNIVYSNEWQSDAVSTLNDYYYAMNYLDDIIYDTSDLSWEERVEHELTSRGWVGVKFFLEDVGNTSEWAKIDGYGNGKSVDYDLLDLLETAAEEPVED